MNGTFQSILLGVLEQVVKQLLGSIKWNMIQQAVIDLMDSSLTGDQRRAKVIADLMEALNLSKTQISLGIEVAVLKNQPKPTV